MGTAGLRVRQHERAEISLEADFVIAEEYRRQVRFSTGSGINVPNVVPCQVDDLSAGGAGLLSNHFVPRHVAGTLRVYGANGAAQRSGAAREVIFEQSVRIRRVSMRDMEPTYALGVSFVDADAAIGDRVKAVLGSFAKRESNCA